MAKQGKHIWKFWSCHWWDFFLVDCNQLGRDYA